MAKAISMSSGPMSGLKAEMGTGGKVPGPSHLLQSIGRSWRNLAPAGYEAERRGRWQREGDASLAPDPQRRPGHVYVIWFDTRDGGSIYFRASDDFGQTWREELA